jgi:hypothetical protein
MLITVVDTAGQPIAGATVTINYMTLVPSRGQTDALGQITLTDPVDRQKAELIVSHPRFQRVLYSITAQNYLSGTVSLSLLFTNEWYYIQRLLELPGDLFELIPFLKPVAAIIRGFLGSLAGWLARQSRPVRLGTDLALLILLYVYLNIGAQIFSGALAAPSIAFLNTLDRKNWQCLRCDNCHVLMRVPPYRQKTVGPGVVKVVSNVLIPATSRVLIEPGTTLEIATGRGLDVLGELVAPGTRDLPIVFRPQDPQGTWGNVYVKGGNLTLVQCTFIRGNGTPTDKRTLDSEQRAADSAEGTGNKPRRIIVDFLDNPQERWENRQKPNLLRGGAIYLRDANQARVKECTFQDCSAAQGGAIYIADTSGYFEACTFRNNHATAGGKLNIAGGGAVFCYRAATPKLFSCTFEDNGALESNSCGGAIYCGEYSCPEITDCIFRRNLAVAQGGAIYCYSTHANTAPDTRAPTMEGPTPEGPINISGTTIFEANVAGYQSNSPLSYGTSLIKTGGAIAIEEYCRVNIKGARFKGNSALLGGAVWIKVPDKARRVPEPITLSQATFEANASVYGNQGGDFALDGTSPLREYPAQFLTISECRFGPAAAFPRCIFFHSPCAAADRAEQALLSSLSQQLSLDNEGLAAENIVCEYAFSAGPPAGSTAQQTATTGQGPGRHAMTHEPHRFALCAAGSSAVLGDVPYLQQPSPVLCQSTAVAMVVNYLRSSAGRAEPVTIDEVHERLAAAGGGSAESQPARKQVLQELLADPEWDWAYEPSAERAVALLQESVAQGCPGIMSVGFTASGHVIVALGLFQQDGEWFVLAHDPYARFDYSAAKPGWDFNQSGALVAYPLRVLSTTVTYALVSDTAGGETITAQRLALDGSDSKRLRITGSPAREEIAKLKLTPAEPERSVTEWMFLYRKKNPVHC